MKKLFTWLVYSSENPENFSLTLKGVVASILPIALLLGKQLGFTLDPQFAEAFVLSVIAVCTTGITLIGAIRKVINTFSAPKFTFSAAAIEPAEKLDPKKKLSTFTVKKKVASKKKTVVK